MSSSHVLPSDEEVAKLLTKEATDLARNSRRPMDVRRPNTQFLRNLLKNTDGFNASLLRRGNVKIPDARDRNSRPDEREHKRRRISNSPEKDYKQSRRHDESKINKERSRSRSTSNTRSKSSRSTRDHGRSRSRSRSPTRRRRHRSRSLERGNTKSNITQRSNRIDERPKITTRDGAETRTRKTEERFEKQDTKSAVSLQAREDSKKPKKTSHDEASRLNSSHGSRDSNLMTNKEQRDVNEPNEIGHREKEKKQRKNKRRSLQRAKKKKQSGSSKAKRVRRNSSSELSDPLEELIGPAPPPRARGRALGSSSNFDRVFDPAYDPKSDVHIDCEDMSQDWDEAVDAFRDQQAMKMKQRERLLQAGFTEDELNLSNKAGPDIDKERDIDSFKWAKKGESREWDKGKTIEQDDGTESSASGSLSDFSSDLNAGSSNSLSDSDSD
jgi:hypothetical protein